MTKFNEDSEITIEFVGVNHDFTKLLNTEFPNDEIAIRSSFGGSEIATLFGDLTPSFTEKLAKFLTAKINANSTKEITLASGDKQINIKGYAGKELETVKPMIDEWIEKLSEN